MFCFVVRVVNCCCTAALRCVAQNQRKSIWVNDTQSFAPQKQPLLVALGSHSTKAFCSTVFLIACFFAYVRLHVVCFDCCVWQNGGIEIERPLDGKFSQNKIKFAMKFSRKYYLPCGLLSHLLTSWFHTMKVLNLLFFASILLSSSLSICILMFLLCF